MIGDWPQQLRARIVQPSAPGAFSEHTASTRDDSGDGGSASGPVTRRVTLLWRDPWLHGTAGDGRHTMGSGRGHRDVFTSRTERSVRCGWSAGQLHDVRVAGQPERAVRCACSVSQLHDVRVAGQPERAVRRTWSAGQLCAARVVDQPERAVRRVWSLTNSCPAMRSPADPAAPLAGDVRRAVVTLSSRDARSGC